MQKRTFSVGRAYNLNSNCQDVRPISVTSI